MKSLQTPLKSISFLFLALINYSALAIVVPEEFDAGENRITDLDPAKRSEGQKSVTFLEVSNDTQTWGCTGVYLSSSVVATTADCVRNAKKIKDYFRDAWARTYSLMPEVTKRLGQAAPKDYDLALLKFDPGTYTGKTWTVSYVPQTMGMPRIFSYGKPYVNNNKPVFRTALIAINSYSDKNYTSTGFPLIIQGDQGAPILNASGELIGLATHGDVPSQNLSEVNFVAGKGTKYFVRIGSNTDVNNNYGIARYLVFYSNAIALGYELPKISCECDMYFDDGTVSKEVTATTLDAKIGKGTVCDLYENQKLPVVHPNNGKYVFATFKGCHRK